MADICPKCPKRYECYAGYIEYSIRSLEEYCVLLSTCKEGYEIYHSRSGRELITLLQENVEKTCGVRPKNYIRIKVINTLISEYS
jgi:hypothetical protein